VTRVDRRPRHRRRPRRSFYSIMIPRILTRYGLAAGFLILTAVACVEPDLPEISNAVQVTPRCEDTAEGSYLPAEMFRLLPKLPSPSGDWTRGPSQILEAMHEPQLSCGVHPDSYRVLWLHSFSNWPPTRSAWPPTVVRASQSNGRWTLTAVQLAGSVNQEEVLRRERLLSQAESQEMSVAVGRFNLWTRQDFSWNRDANDGAMWVVEGRRGRTYHPAILINSDSEAIDRLAGVFLRMAGIDPRMLHEGVDVSGI
jgi:hypothetical protein